MQIFMTVLREEVRKVESTEYVTLTGLEEGTTPLLQMIDYTLRTEEHEHKGKLVGKKVKIQVESIRAVFSGRPQLSGRLLP